jgi:aerobic-type carbon monoxide dehydrogenase small subunit (CoxS/CutS family)
MSSTPEPPADDLSRRDFLHQATGALVVVGGAAGLAEPPPAVGDAPPPDAPATVPVTLRINGRKDELKLEPRVTLLDALREYAGLTGTKKGCDHGQCGACTVLIDGRRIYSCLTLAIMHTGAEVKTIEGLADGDTLHPLQMAFIEHDAFEIALASAAVALEIKDGKITAARLALGGVATRPWRTVEAEKVLVGAKPEEAAYREAARVALQGARPQKFNAFKIELARNTIVRALWVVGNMP